MTLLNLKTFLNNTTKKGELYYYEHIEYHIFTNGKIAYGFRKGIMIDLQVKYLKELEELSNNYKAKLRTSNSLDEIVNTYKNGNRAHVTNYENGFINNNKK